MKRALTAFSVLLIVLATFVVVAMSANAESEGLFLIGFDGSSNEKLIRQYGGTITTTHSNSHVITARLTHRESRSLARNSHIAYVEEDFTLRIDAQTLPYGVDYIDADLVHSRYTGSGVKVAVIDTGIDYSHPDLDGNYKGGYDFVNRDSYPMDDHGHGTHVAGIIAAEDNDIGVIGVAPEADLYSLKVIDSNGYGYVSNIIAGIEWAVDNNMDVISMSIGSNYPSSSLQRACDVAEDAGLVLVAAAGNGGTLGGTEDTVAYPARYSSVIAVGATDHDNNRPSWSSTGPTVELASPGVSIYSTTRSSSYGTKSGTSMACPHVSGVAALILSSDPDLTNAEVRERMQTTAYDLGLAGRDTFFGYGLVDAAEAIPEPEPSKSMHVASIDMSYTQVSRSYTVHTNVKIVDAGSSPVQGATVTVLLRFGTRQRYSETLSGITSSDGTVTLDYGPTKQKGTYEATVTNVQKTAWTYDSTANLETRETIKVKK